MAGETFRALPGYTQRRQLRASVPPSLIRNAGTAFNRAGNVCPPVELPRCHRSSTGVSDELATIEPQRVQTMEWPDAGRIGTGDAPERSARTGAAGSAESARPGESPGDRTCECPAHSAGQNH